MGTEPLCESGRCWIHGAFRAICKMCAVREGPSRHFCRRLPCKWEPVGPAETVVKKARGPFCSQHGIPFRGPRCLQNVPQKLTAAELAVISTLRSEASSSVSFFAVCQSKPLCSHLKQEREHGWTGKSAPVQRRGWGWGGRMSHYAAIQIDSHIQCVVLGLDLGRDMCWAGERPWQLSLGNQSDFVPP